MTQWYDYKSKYPQNTVVGELRLLDEMYSPHLDNTRHLLVWLPSSYHDTQNNYPVIYMHDGDNLFDESKTYSGEWQVDETLTQLASEGIEAIVVGIPNMGDERFSEYSPYPHSERGA
ncbi:MAG: alpha/beta hydrolase-fold protein, partial [Chloroflexota bacterium]